MSRLHFAPINERTEEIIEAVMETPEIQSNPSVEFTLHLAVEELVSNIVNYAYPVGADGKIDINVSADDSKITLDFIDSGTPFNPLLKEDPDTTLGIRERAIGGLGIFLVKQTMNEVTYRYEDGHNILTISKSCIPAEE